MLIKTFISGAAGALILPAGMYLLVASNWPALAGRLANPGEWVSSTGSIWLIAISAMASGAIMVIICNPPGFISCTRHAIVAGFLSGIFLWLGSNAMTAQGMGRESIALILYSLSMAITDSIPFFSMFCVAFAFVAIFGGLASEAVLVISSKVIGHRKATQ